MGGMEFHTFMTYFKIPCHNNYEAAAAAVAVTITTTATRFSAEYMTSATQARIKTIDTGCPCEDEKLC
jgi:hypothetical protein